MHLPGELDIPVRRGLRDLQVRGLIAGTIYDAQFSQLSAHDHPATGTTSRVMLDYRTGDPDRVGGEDAFLDQLLRQGVNNDTGYPVLS